MRRFAVFNPEHDLALSNGDKHFIAPRNIREMGHDLAPLMEFIEGDDILVWGWDHAVKEQLLRQGVVADRLPTDAALTALREYSGRATAHRLLKAFRSAHPDGPYTGESIRIHDISEIPSYAIQHGHILLKDPYSSSGKGLRHLNFDVNDNHPSGRTLTSPLQKIESWANALIRRHSYLTAEPHYDKVQDFAMEFCIRDGQCRFIGYSLFTTNSHGRYEANILMTDEKIEAHLSQYVPQASLHEVRDWVISHYSHIIPTEWDTTLHPLHFGIDMMVVNFQLSMPRISEDKDCLQALLSVAASTKLIFNSQFKIHPCVEINLRLNMGIIAHEVRRTLLAPEAEGSFHVASFPTAEALLAFADEQKQLYPSVSCEGRFVEGYHPLTPILSHTCHHAYIRCVATPAT